MITLKFAKSADNYMGQVGKQIWISNEESGIYTHKLRSEVDGILVGSETVIVDDPRLTVRNYNGDSPIPIILDRRQRLSTNSKVFNEHEKIIYITDSKRVMPPNVQVLSLEGTTGSWDYIMSQLYELDIYHILVEGGAKVFKSLLNEYIWDDAHIISSKDLLHVGILAPNLEGHLENKYELISDTIYHILNKEIYRQAESHFVNSI